MVKLKTNIKFEFGWLHNHKQFRPLIWSNLILTIITEVGIESYVDVRDTLAAGLLEHGLDLTWAKFCKVQRSWSHCF